MSLNNGGSLFTVSPPPNNEIENYFKDPSNSKEVPLDCEGRAWNRTHYRYDAKNLPKTSITANGTLPVTFIGGQVVLTGAVTSITLPTATQLKTQIETVWGAGTSTSYPWAWVVRTEFDNQTAGVVNLVMGAGDTALPGAGISFPANSLSEVEFQIMNSSPTATAIRVAIIANSSAAAGSNVTLTDGGTNETIIVNGTGPNLVIKDFAAGFLQDDNDYFDNVGASFQNRVAAGTLYLTLPDSGVRSAGDLQFQGASDFITVQNAYNAAVAAGANTVLIPSYRTWDLSGGTLAVSNGMTITGGGKNSQTAITVNDNTAFTLSSASLQFLIFTGTLNVDEPAYAVTTNTDQTQNVRLNRCQFRAVGLSCTCGGFIVEDCNFLQYRNSIALNLDPANSISQPRRVVGCSFRNYWIILGFPANPIYTTALSGEAFTPGTAYTVGSVVIDSTNSYAYVLRTVGTPPAVDEPSGFGNTITGADGYVWQYMVPAWSCAIYADPDGSFSNLLVTDNLFCGVWYAFEGCWGQGSLISDNQLSGNYGFMHNGRVPNITVPPSTFSDVQVVNNSIQNAYFGLSCTIAETGTFDRLHVISNQFTSLKSGIIAQFSGTGSNEASGWNISHNSFKDYGYGSSAVPNGILIESGDDSTEPYYSQIVIDGNTLDATPGTAQYGIQLAGGGAGTSTYFIISNNISVTGGGVANIDVGTYPLAANARLVEDNVAP